MTKKKKNIGVTRATAERLINEFIDRVKVINDSNEYLSWITRVAIFGSYLKGKERPGDIDIFFKMERREKDGEKWAELRDERVRIAEASGRKFRDFFARLCWDEHEIILFIKNKSTALSLHDWSDFERLQAQTGNAVEHKVIYEFTP